MSTLPDISGSEHFSGHGLKSPTVNITNSNGTAVEEPYLYLEHHVGWMVLAALIIGLAALIGTLGNILIVLAVCCVRALRTCGNVLVLNLSLADLIVTLLIDPFNVVGAVAGRSVLLANPNLCNWIASFCAPACMSSMWNMCAISLNRYVLICKPHLYPRIFTFKSTILCCVCIWVLAHLLHMPNHIGWGQNKFNAEYYLCTFDIATHSYGVFYIMTGVVIPLIGVLFGYTAIFLKVRSVKLQIRQHQKSILHAASGGNKTANLTENGANKTATSTENGKINGVQETTDVKRKRPQKPGFTHEDVKLAKTLFAAFIVFLICWLPFAILVTAHDPSEVPAWMYVIAIIMAHGNSAVNPILYGLTNEKFREGYRNVLGLNNRVAGDKTAFVRNSVTYGHGLLPDATSTNNGSTRARASVDQTRNTSVHPV